MIKYITIFIFLQLILIVPSFFWYKKIINKLEIRNSKLVSFILTFIMPIIYTLTFIFIYINVVEPIILSKKFTSETWIENVDSRYKMINDLEENKLLIGKKRIDIIKMLGPDYEENCWIKNTICYPAPNPDDFSILDHYVLIIYFNKTNVVKKIGYQMI